MGDGERNIFLIRKGDDDYTMLLTIICRMISQVLTQLFQVPLLNSLDEYNIQRQLREEEKRKSRV